MRVISKLFDSDRRRIPKSPKHLDSDESVTLSSSLSDITTGSSSLDSSLSLQTLPSVPSLQKIPSTTVTVSHSVTSSFKLRERSLPVTCLAVNGGYLFAVSGHEVSIYDRDMCAHLDTFNGQDPFSGTVKSVGFSGEKIFTAHQDGKIGVWKLTAKSGYKQLTTLPTLNDRLRRFALPKNYVQVRRHKKRLWIEHADAVTALAVNNGFIYSVSWDKTLKIWRASDLRCKESIKAHDDAVNAVAVSTNGTVYTGSADRRIRVWAKPTGEKRHTLVATLEKHKSAVNALALNDDGSVLFSGSCDRSILVWEREDTSNYMAVRGALRGHDKAILSLFNVSDLLLSGSADRTVRIWRRGPDSSYSCLEVLSGHTKPVKSLAAVREKELDDVVSIVSGSLDGEVKCWKVSVTKPDNSFYTNLVQ
ncbi:WD40-repeat-containing domain superfamily [Arabidopsis thaliana x Arabidopsis arenosa]|uniref:WD40-repeat-containing domain superfamily n=1 Tax=Arabidopsis thaliana x Arabidopsis arenosa TaxID=1240361 RepID=A0A8T2C458_9BRAS|nr:WD40-repeat-containing domain superfamily [Arabidopsis thaliana x Arabidopsis arenosa]